MCLSSFQVSLCYSSSYQTSLDARAAVFVFKEQDFTKVKATFESQRTCALKEMKLCRLFCKSCSWDQGHCHGSALTAGDSGQELH